MENKLIERLLVEFIYTEKDCDLIIGIDTNNGDCYIIPINDIKNWGNSRKLRDLQDYKENWNILIELAKFI